MSQFAITGPRFAAAAPTDTTDETASTEPTAEEAALAKQYPPGMVKIENSGLKLGLQIPGGLLAVGGAALLGISLLSRGSAGAGASRLLAAPLVAGGAMIGIGAGTALGAELIPPKERLAVATNIPTRVKAQEIANKMIGRQAKVVEDIGGKFAVIDEGPVNNSRGYDYGRGHYYGDGHYHGHHYYGDGHNHNPGYYEPYYPGHDYGGYYPSYPDAYPDPWYPTPSGGYTSPGDDYDYPSSGGGYNPPSSGGGTSRGDDYPSSGGGNSGGYTPPAYDPPSYDPPSYDPPSYDPPSYDPPSYDPPSYDPPSYDSGGGYDSSDNGNPSYDDF